MKKTAILMLAALALVAACTEKEENEVSNDAAKRKFDAWISVNFPNATKTGLGAYVISDTPGTGKAAGTYEDNNFVRIDYVYRTLDGKIQGYTGATTAKQLDSYDRTKYYGPQVISRTGLYDIAGLEESIAQMSEGGSRTVVIPGWLNSYVKYDTEEEYLRNVSGTNVIYDFTLVEVFDDYVAWECDSIERYIAECGFADVQNDTTGFYFIRTGEPSSEEEYADGDEFEINYTGMRLDGQLFDTTIRDAAERAGLSLNRTFETKTITMHDNYSDITLEGSTLVRGFAMALKKLHPGEKATVLFCSDLGYETSGSGASIPGFCPLRFDLEVVE